MAGGSNTTKSSQKPSSSSAAPSNRKSRWESSTNNPPSDPKSDSKSSKPHNSSSKSAISPNSTHPKHPTDKAVNPTPASAPLPSPGVPLPFPDSSALGPPPPPSYGFHMLERRTIVLADGSVRSYFSLPLDYHDFTPPSRSMDLAGRFLPMGSGGPGHEYGGFDHRFPPGGPMSPDEFRGVREEQFGRARPQDHWNSRGTDERGGPADSSMKRKFNDDNEKDRKDEKDDLSRRQQQFLHNGNANGFLTGSGERRGDFLAGTSDPYGRTEDTRFSKYMRVGGSYENEGLRLGSGNNVAPKYLEVDQNALRKAFLHFVKTINENANQKKNYLEDGKHGRLQCLACARSSRDFPDMHGLIMHTYNSESADLQVDHLGLHKALCVLMGWNYSKPPDNSRGYRFLSADEAAANQEDLIMWPPIVIIHNTITGKSKDGRMEGLGNKAMDSKVRDLGFGGGKSKSLYGRDGHLGTTLIKFSGDQSGLNEAKRLAEFFEKDNHGRTAWARVRPAAFSRDDDKNPNLVKVDEKSGEKKRIFYGYLATAADMDKVDFDTRKKVTIESYRDFKSSG
ncbi:uncharacterized protein LOC120067168 [Benincasa hispida]|uniref:uncharacterized protein LOC120067168 n=1 Tax=Benincasa hispida TaxID=102211 RepID=UPI0018FFDB4C|nr:uncharacterized protein LOC120067168 [Benincasa hispida]